MPNTYPECTYAENTREEKLDKVKKAMLLNPVLLCNDVNQELFNYF